MITEAQITTATPEALPSILGELARLTAIATLRLTAPIASAVEPDEWLTPEAVAGLLKIEPKAVRRLAAIRPYRRALSARKFVYSRASILRFLRRAS